MHAVLLFFSLLFETRSLSVVKANTELLVLPSAKIMRLKACTTISGREFYSPSCDGSHGATSDLPLTKQLRMT